MTNILDVLRLKAYSKSHEYSGALQLLRPGGAVLGAGGRLIQAPFAPQNILVFLNVS